MFHGDAAVAPFIVARVADDPALDHGQVAAGRDARLHRRCVVLSLEASSEKPNGA